MLVAGEIVAGASAPAAVAIASRSNASRRAAPGARRRIEAPGAGKRGGRTGFTPFRRVAARDRRWILARSLFTGTPSREVEILVVVAEIGVRVHLGHSQFTRGRGRKLQPRLGIAVFEVHEIALAYAHDFAREAR